MKFRGYDGFNKVGGEEVLEQINPPSEIFIHVFLHCRREGKAINGSIGQKFKGPIITYPKVLPEFRARAIPGMPFNMKIRFMPNSANALPKRGGGGGEAEDAAATIFASDHSSPKGCGLGLKLGNEFGHGGLVLGIQP